LPLAKALYIEYPILNLILKWWYFFSTKIRVLSDKDHPELFSKLMN